MNILKSQARIAARVQRETVAVPRHEHLGDRLNCYYRAQPEREPAAKLFPDTLNSSVSTW